VAGGGGGTIVATSGRWVRTEGWGTRGQGGVSSRRRKRWGGVNCDHERRKGERQEEEDVEKNGEGVAHSPIGSIYMTHSILYLSKFYLTD
jgi:hypothetical protein